MSLVNNKELLVEKLIEAEAHERECSKSAFLSKEGRARYQEAHHCVFELQRQIAAIDKLEYCRPFDFPYQWDTGAPMPHLLKSDNKAFLIYYLRVPADSAWDGKSVAVVNPATSDSPVAVVEFRAWAASLGMPNDEGLQAHRLWGRGLDYYTPLTIENSEQVKAINAMYPFSTKYKLVHYIFPFHDSTFECVAESYSVEVVLAPLKEVVLEVASRLF